MSIAESWYDSGTAWAAAGVVVAAIMGIATLVVTYRVGNPKRRVHYGMQLVVQMLKAPEGVRSDLELFHRGKQLADPYIVELQITGRGRKDIPSSAFDGGAPIRLDVSTQVVEVLQVISKPESLPVPKVEASKSEIRIGPSFIGKRQTVSITALTDGHEPALTWQSSLIDVQISPDPPETLRLFIGLRVALGGIASLVIWAFVIPAWISGGLRSAGVVFLIASLIATAVMWAVMLATIGIRRSVWRWGDKKLKMSRNDEIARYREGRTEILFAVSDRRDGISQKRGVDREVPACYRRPGAGRVFLGSQQLATASP